MGETRYPLGDDYVRFGYDDSRYGCLCTFPYNYSKKEFGIGTVESFALLGAALCLYRNQPSLLEKEKYDDEYVVPDCLPEWIRDEIRRNLGDYPEKFDGYEYDADYLSSEASLKDYYDLKIKRLEEIKKWCDEEIKELKQEYEEEKDSSPE